MWRSWLGEDVLSGHVVIHSGDTLPGGLTGNGTVASLRREGLAGEFVLNTSPCPGFIV